jgi:predicted DNA-binding protein (MmcQ/YjbR family)
MSSDPTAEHDLAGGTQPPASMTPQITGAELPELCLGRRGAREEFPFRPELSVFKVAGKMFALSALSEEPLRVSIKCDPELGEQLRFTHPSIEPGYHLNKRHWLTITIDGSLPDALVANLIEGSHELVTAPATPRRRSDRSAE